MWTNPQEMVGVGDGGRGRGTIMKEVPLSPSADGGMFQYEQEVGGLRRDWERSPVELLPAPGTCAEIQIIVQTTARARLSQEA